jgi:hypothetical protein
MSLAHRSLQQHIPKTMAQNVLCKRLQLHAYKIQILHEFEEKHQYTRAEFANLMLCASDDIDNFLQQVMYTNKATLHMNSHVNRRNYHIQGQEGPHEMYKHVPYSMTINVWCGITHDPVRRPFFCAENTIMANIYLDYVTVLVFPQTDGNEQQDKGKILFQQDGARLHLRHEERNSLNIRFPNQWIGRGRQTPWPP